MAQDITVIPRKHKSKRDRALASAEAQPPAAPEPGSSEPKPKKKKRSKTAEGTDHADVPTEVAEVPGSEPGTDEKRKKKARTVEEEVETAPDIAPSTDIRKEKKKKRKDRDAETEEHVPVLEPVTVEAQLAGTETKKKKKSKTQDSSAVESSQAASSVPESAALSAPAVADADKPKKIKKPKWSAERKAEAKKERAAKSKEAEAAVVPDMPTTEVTVPATEDATLPAVADITTSSSEPRKKRKKRATKQDAAELPAPTEPLSASPAREKQSAKAHKSSSPKSPQRRSSSPVPSKKDATVEERAASDPSAGADDTVDITQIGDEDEEAGSGSEKGDVEQNASEDDENDLHLHGFSSGEDSSDDEMDAEEFNGFDVSSLPTIARDDATVKRKLDKAKRQPTEDRGVIYLGRIPHGFYEDQMRAYFSQFGDVTRLRLSRSKKTGRSKHYGFIEFDSAAVAGIVAETMNNYLLMGHILKCKVIPKEEVHPLLWIGANRKWHQVPRDRLARVRHNKPRTEDAQHIAESRLLKRQQAKKRKLLEVGIDYDFDAVAYKKPKAIPLVA